MTTWFVNLAYGLGLRRLHRGPLTVATDFECPGPGSAFAAHDTLAIEPDNSPAANTLLEKVRWAPAPFTVRVLPCPRRCDARVAFPSPLPGGDERNDTVLLDWHAARDNSGRVVEAPAVVCLDILKSINVVSGLVGRTFARCGVHGFVMHMPQYVGRFNPAFPRSSKNLLARARQAVADARRARDAVVALPHVLPQVGLQGTSLGGFLSSVAASLDNAFAPVFLVISGADLYRVITEGKLDARTLRWQFRMAGLEGNRLREALDEVEPLHVAHRLDPARTWVFPARSDTVVPPECTRRLVERAGIAAEHVRPLPGGHYTSIFHLIGAVEEMARIVRQSL